MLDTDTKRKIDTARDILVGKVPDPKSQVEQITIALIYKFMDDMDLQSEELGGERSFFKGEFEKYAWRKIFDPRMGGFEILNLYSEAIMKMNVNPNIPQLFRDIFKNAYLPYRDPETLKLFLKIINEFTYDHSERLGDAFEYLLSVLGSQGEAGQFRTPRHIIDFMVAIIDPEKGELILDPACGTAGFLISSYNHIIKNNTSNYDPAKDIRMFETKDLSLSEIVINSKNYTGDKLTPDERSRLANNIKGYDISPDMVRLSLVNMYLHGLHAPHIYEYDTLTSEDNWNEYADVILANPPFMSPKGGIRPHKRFSISSNRSEVLFVDYIAEHLTPNGRAAVIVPEGIIFQSGTAYKNLRKMLVENYLVGVISLPAGVFNPYSGVKTSILWLDHTLAKKTDKILFVKIENDGFDLGAQRKPIGLNDLPTTFNEILNFKEWIITKPEPVYKGKLNALFVSKDLISRSKEYHLSGQKYIEKEIIPTKFLSIKFENAIQKVTYTNKIKTSVFKATGKYPIIDQSDNYIAGYWDNEEDVFKILKPITIFGDHTRCFKYVDFDFVLGADGVKILQPIDEFHPKFFYYLIREVNLPNLGYSRHYKELKDGLIPLPPLSVQEEIVAEIESYQKIIDGARQVVENYKPRIEIDPEWKVVELGEVCELATGGTPRSTIKEYYEGGDIKWLVSGDIHKEEIYDCEGRITEAGFKNSNAKFLPINSVLIALNGQGKTRGTVAILRVKATCNQSIVSINPTNTKILLPEFLYLQLKAKYQEIRNITGDNQRSGLNMLIINGIKICLPEISIQKELVTEFMQENEIVKNNIVLIERFEQKIKDRIAKVWGT